MIIFNMELIYWQLSSAEANMTKVWTIVVSSVTAGRLNEDFNHAVLHCPFAELLWQKLWKNFWEGAGLCLLYVAQKFLKMCTIKIYVC